MSHDKDGDFLNDDPYQFPDLVSAIEAAKIALTEMAADGIPLENGSSAAIEVQNDDRNPIVHLRLHFTIDFVQPSAARS